MKQRVVLVATALSLAALIGCKKSDAPAAGSASASAGSASGSDPWASSSGNGSGSGSGTGTASGSGSSAPAKPAPPSAVTAKLEHPFLFHATKDGSHDVWLFGTIHLGVDPQALPDVVLGKLDASAAFAMEADITDMSLMGSMMRNDGSSLEKELGPEYWKKFSDAVGEAAAERLGTMKTFAAATVLDIEGMPITVPLDSALLQRAKKATKTVVFLEPAIKQLAILEKWMDVRALKEMLDDLDETKKKNFELITAYVAGDESKAIEMAKDDSDFVKQGRTHADFVAFMKDLLLDRNASWIPTIEDNAKKGDIFVAVGAMHLIGPGSVPDLLSKHGWKVERVTP